MTAPRTGGASVAAVPTLSQAELTAAEARLLRLFRKMDEGSKELLEVTAGAWAADFPVRSARSLKLVPGGTS